MIDHRPINLIKTSNHLTICMLGIFYDVKSRPLANINFFNKIKSFRNTNRVSSSLDPDQARLCIGPDLVQTVCKGYQLVVLAGKKS